MAGVLLLCLLTIFFIGQARQQLPYEPLTLEEIQQVRAAAPIETPLREGVVEAGLELLGKVNYFWGGKSTAEGMDPAWGQPRLVESEGSQSSGTTRPYGLDCSGFVAWCYIQQGFSSQQVEELVGYGTWNQWDRSESISFHQLRVGDWAFQNKYPTDQGNHIGICIGFDQKGKPLFLHCASSFDNVVVTGAGDVFRYARRPLIYSPDGGGLTRAWGPSPDGADAEHPAAPGGRRRGAKRPEKRAEASLRPLFVWQARGQKAPGRQTPPPPGPLDVHLRRTRAGPALLA